MRRPKRTHINPTSLSCIGIPKKFHDKSIKMDFNTYKDSDLIKVKSSVLDYMSKIESLKPSEVGGLYLYGSNGVGKTFIASMIIKHAYMFRYTARRCTFVEYITAYTSAWGSKSSTEREEYEDSLYNNYKSVEYLALEEVGKEVDSKIASPILEDLLRYREDNGLVTIICTNLSLKDMSNRYGASIISLLKGNMIPVKIVKSDRREEVFEEMLENEKW